MVFIFFWPSLYNAWLHYNDCSLTGKQWHNLLKSPKFTKQLHKVLGMQHPLNPMGIPWLILHALFLEMCILIGFPVCKSSHHRQINIKSEMFLGWNVYYIICTMPKLQSLNICISKSWIFRSSRTAGSEITGTHASESERSKGNGRLPQVGNSVHLDTTVPNKFTIAHS